MKQYFTFSLLFLLPLALFGHTQLVDPCELYISLEYEQWDTDHFWNKHGKRRDALNDFEKDEVKAHIEFGLTQTDTLTARSSWARFDESINGRTFGFTDLEFGWTHLFCQRAMDFFAWQFLVIFPFEYEYKPPLRYGRNGYEASLIYTKYFNWCERLNFFDTQIGYRTYDGFPSDQIRGRATLGTPLFSWLYIVGTAKAEYGLFNGKNRKDASLIWLNPNYRLVRVEIEADIAPCRLGYLNIGYFRHVWGENVGTGGGFYGGAHLFF